MQILVRPYYAYNDAVNKRNLKYIMWLTVLNLIIPAVHDSYKYISSHLTKSTSSELLPSMKTTVSLLVINCFLFPT